MPDQGRLAKLIERRKRQEKENDRIRVHKNKLDNMRLEKLASFFEWSKNISKQEHLNAEAKCIKNLEKIYERQSKIEDEKKLRALKEKKEKEEKVKRAMGINKSDSPEEEVVIQARRKITSASKQEQAKNFMSKAKSLSSGYRDNDPPQSYYRRKGTVPPERVVSAEMGYSAQAQNGGGFLVPSSASHISNLKKWQGAGGESVTSVSGTWSQIDFSRPDSPPPTPERPYSVFEALKAMDGGEGLEILREEDESSSGVRSARSSYSDAIEDEIHHVKMVNIRPSTAPGGREPVSEVERNRQLSSSEKGILTESGDSKADDDRPQPKGRGILLKRLSKRPSTARTGFSLESDDGNTKLTHQSSTISFADLPEDDKEGVVEDGAQNRLQMRRQSSAISFSDLPPQNRRKSLAAPPLALLHRRKSNVAAIQRSIEERSKLLRPKSNKMKKKTGGRMGLMQSVMTNAENEILVRKLNEKSRSLQEERTRRLQRAQSAPAGGRRIQSEENYPTLRRLTIANREIWKDKPSKKDKGQKALLEANVTYSSKLDGRVKAFMVGP